MRRLACLLVASALGWVGACGRPTTSPRAAVKVLIEVVVTPADAEIWVDGRYVATVNEAAGGLRVPQGRHEIEITREGYFPYLAVLDIAAPTAHPPRLEATLFPVVREPPTP